MIVFPVTRMNFISLTEPSPGPKGEGAQYQVAVPVSEVPRHVVEMMPQAISYANRSRWKLFSLRSNRRPHIFGMETDSSDLEPLRYHATMTGTCIDMLLRDRPAEVCCSLFEKTRSSDSHGICLVAIRIDGKAVPLPTWDDVISEEL